MISCLGYFSFLTIKVCDSTAAVIVARKEMWRRKAIWDRVQDFRTLTGIPITSHIISLIIGSEEKAHEASQYVTPSLFSFFSFSTPMLISLLWSWCLHVSNHMFFLNRHLLRSTYWIIITIISWRNWSVGVKALY